MGKIIGIDFGTKRVGVAVSDESGSVAFPRATIQNDSRLVPTIVALVQQEHATTVVIGESRNWSGEENPVMKDVKAFVAELTKATDVAIHYEPEFYSSKEARREGQQGSVDAQAATIILNSFITKQKPQ